MKAIKLIIILSVLILLSSCKGQVNVENKTTQSNSYSVSELASGFDEKIWVIYQDQKENYWFGSNGKGVFHYDGKNLKQYTKEDGLAGNQIREIQGDNLGNVFIGTPEGVSKYDGTRFTSLKAITSPSNKWKLEPDDLWFNCNGNHIYRYDGKNLYELQLPRKDLKKAFGIDVKGVPFKEMNNSPYAVYGIDKDKEGNIWFGTATAGVFRYDGESFLWIAENELSTLPDGRVPGVRSMLEDKDGNFWLSNFISKYKISKEDSIVKYEKLEGIDMSTGHFQNRIPYFNSGLSDNNNLWMTTYTGGVWKYDGDKLFNFPVKNGKTEVLLISIYKDHKGVLWLGTDNAGVYKFNGKAFEKFEPTSQTKTLQLFPTKTKSLDYDPYFIESKTISSSYGPNSITRNIIQDKNGHFWFASWEGIIHYDGETFTNFTNKEGLKRFHTFSVLEDKTGDIWFGTIGAGVYRYNQSAQQAGGKTFTHFTTKEGLVNNDVTSIFEDKAGNIWLGTQNGLSRYDGISFHNFTTKDGLSNNDVNSIIEDKNGLFWFGTRGEACFYDGKTFTNFTMPKGLPFTNVRSIIEDEKGNIWLGGNDGLWRYDGNLFTNFTKDFVGYIFEDKKGNIWTSASASNTYTMELYRYDEKTLLSGHVNSTQIIQEDGQVFGVSEDADGNIWFGTENGACRYDGKDFHRFSGKERK